MVTEDCAEAAPAALLSARPVSRYDIAAPGVVTSAPVQLEIVGDLITELAMRYDGDEGLFRAYVANSRHEPPGLGPADAGESRLVHCQPRCASR